MARGERSGSQGPATSPVDVLSRAACLAGGGALSGLFYALSLPKPDLGILAWVSLLPLLFVLSRPRPVALPTRHVALAGLLSGLVAGTGRVYWIAETLNRYGGLTALEATSTTVLLILYLALYPAIFFTACYRWRRSGAAFPWLAAAGWVLLDWVQTWMISGFPWATLGATQYRWSTVAQAAAVVGIHGITFAIVFVNAALAQVLAGPDRRQAWVHLLPASALVAAGLLYGDHRLDELAAEGRSPGTALRIGIVQGNIPQDVKWETDRRTAATNRYVHLTRELAAGEPHDLIVWPETALPFRLDGPGQDQGWQRVAHLARQLKTSLLVGSLGTRSPRGTTGLFNRSFLFDAEGHAVGAADKVHLVPFGEYLPLPWLFGYLRGLTTQSGAFDPGQGHGVLRLRGSRADVGFGVFICYEAIFPSIPRRLVRRGASFLINTTNDAWFGTTAAPYQHLAMVVMRAVETGRTVVRAANTGISGAITPDGKVHARTALFTTQTRSVRVVPRDEVTPYVRWGDAVFVLSAGILALAAARAITRRRWAVIEEVTQARRELETLGATPAELQRDVVLLPGYGSSPEVMHGLQEHLRRAFRNADERVRLLDLRHDLSLERLIGKTATRLPPGPRDYVGHSLGGLVAAGVALTDGDPRARVFALATPLQGTRLATLARMLGFPYPRILADLRPGTAALRTLRWRLGQLPGLFHLRLSGDPVAPGIDGLELPPCQVGVFHVPYLLGPMQRHRLIHADPRVALFLIRALRGAGPPSRPPTER